MSKTNNPGESNLGNFANLKRMAHFAAVVETGSFTAAADRLGITKAVVSQRAARLKQPQDIAALPSGGIHAVFPAARFRPAKVRAFVELMQERI